MAKKRLIYILLLFVLATSCANEKAEQPSNESNISELVSDIKSSPEDGVISGEEELTATLPEPMTPPRMVNDFVGILTAEQQSALEAKIEAFDKSTSTQIAVVTVANLGVYDISDYATRLFDKWGIGDAKNNNGILILVKPKTQSSRGEVFIATGYGVEGAVPDALAGRIIDYEMIPQFKENDYYTGIDNAVNTLISLTKGEFTAKEYVKKTDHNGIGLGALFFLIFIIFGFIASMRAKKRGETISSRGGTSTVGGFPYFGGGGGFGGFSGGGGGFGGFGGGSSGGGGAGGSW